MPTFEISGKTFDHRETLKAAGARWNGVTKTWTLSSDNADAIRALAGVTVREAGAAKPDAPKPAPTRGEILDRLAVPMPKPVPAGVIEYLGKTRVYESMFRGNAGAYAEFGSVAELVNFCESLNPYTLGGGPSQNPIINEDTRNWWGSKTFAAAVELSRTGWPEGIEIANVVREFLSVNIPERRKRRNALVGGSVNVGRMLAGNPVHMRRRENMPQPKVITLISDAAMSLNIDSNDIAIRAAIISTIVDALENNGYSVELFTVNRTTEALRVTGDRSLATVIKVKNAGEKTNLSDLMFGLGHPAMMRRFIFPVILSSQKVKAAHYCTAYPTDITNGLGELPANTYVLGRIKHGQNIVGSVETKIRKLLALVVPANLPIEINTEKE